MLKIIADENIAYAEEAFSLLGDISFLHGREITNEVLKKADVLLVRSVTNVDEKLLDGTKVKFIGTATIGTDHIDTKYLNENNIAFSSAKGCNADAVAEYVLTAISKIVAEKNLLFNELTIGVVGCGNIGSRVAKYVSALGMKVLKNDPPLQRISKNNNFVSIDEIENADIITLHVPLNTEGIDKTVHLFNKERLLRLKENSILINTSRGAVVDNNALLEILQSKNITTVLDVWENEPQINEYLLKMTTLATPHIAGYTLEGKVNGTKIIYDALCRFLNVKSIWKPELPSVTENRIKIKLQQPIEEIISLLSSRIYDIKNDDLQLKNSENPVKNFDLLRKYYPLRREFNNYFIEFNQQNEKLEKTLKTLRFNIK